MGAWAVGARTMDPQRNRNAFEELCLFYRVDLPIVNPADGEGTERKAVERAQQVLPTVDDFWAGRTNSRSAATEAKATTDTRAEPMSVDEFWQAMMPNNHSADDHKTTLTISDHGSEPKRQRLAPAREKQEQDPALPPKNEKEATTDDDDNARRSDPPRRSVRTSGREGVRKREWWKATDTPEKPAVGA